jgi:hypothetical protein
MDDESRRLELADFLKTRRMRLSPERVGIVPIKGEQRRTPGLRREEVAHLAGLSVAWYTWLEQTREIKVSRAAMERLAKALRLDEVETQHLHELTCSESDLSPINVEIDPDLEHLINELAPNPAYIKNRRWDVIAANAAARAVFHDFGAIRLGGTPNILRFIFLDPATRELFVDWSGIAVRAVAQFRHAADIGELETKMLIADLARDSTDFASLWARHDVAQRRVGGKKLSHPAFGPLSFQHASFAVLGRPGLQMVVYVAASRQTANVLTSLSACGKRRHSNGQGSSKRRNKSSQHWTKAGVSA